jgi:hypothetical protein
VKGIACIEEQMVIRRIEAKVRYKRAMPTACESGIADEPVLLIKQLTSRRCAMKPVGPDLPGAWEEGMWKIEAGSR